MTKWKNLSNWVKPEIIDIIINIEVIKILISKNKVIFTQLKKAFRKTVIFQYFDLKYNIWIKTNASDYIINRVLSQLILNFSQ